MNQRSTEYLNLCDDLQKLMHGKKLDDIIPALTTVLAYALSDSDTEKKKCISYVVGTIDYVFERASDEEKNNS